MPLPPKRRAGPRALGTEAQRLRKAIDECSARIDRLETEVEINIRRMAAMQAEIDHLRSMHSRR
jgi:hypothetical protein